MFTVLHSLMKCIVNTVFREEAKLHPTMSTERCLRCALSLLSQLPCRTGLDIPYLSMIYKKTKIKTM
jgi:hypothetical protein